MTQCSGFQLLAMQGIYHPHMQEILSEKKFELDRYKYDANYGTWAKIILTLVEQASTSTFGPANAIITIHKGSILMLIPIRSRKIMIGLVLQRSVNQEYLITKILDLLD